MKNIMFLIGCLVLLAGSASPQEVIVTDFPLGVGGEVGKDFFKPYYMELKAISDTLQEYPLFRAIITGGADGSRYQKNNDAQNPGLALGRAHALRDYLIDEFKIDPAQLIIQSEDVKLKGARYRYAGIRIVRELADLETRVGALESRPPVEKHFTEVREIAGDFEETLKLQFGAGLSSSPFGLIPIVSSGMKWKGVVLVEGMVGHTFWNNTYRFENTDLDTKRRMIGGHVIVYPFENKPVGIIGGWNRTEEISQEYYEYVRLSEGPVLGLRVSPVEFLSFTGVYNPSRQRVTGAPRSGADNDQFLISVMAHMEFGGGK